MDDYRNSSTINPSAVNLKKKRPECASVNWSSLQRRRFLRARKCFCSRKRHVETSRREEEMGRVQGSGGGGGKREEKSRTRLWTGLDWTFSLRGIFSFRGGGCIIFSSLLKNRVFNLSPTGYIFLIWRGGREGLYFSFSLCFSLRLVDSRSSSFPWKLKKIAGVDVT